MAPGEAERQSQSAQESSRGARRAQAEFLANMDHEILTPMNVILGMTELALQGGLAPAERALVGKARDAAQGLLGILNDLLDIARIEAGAITLEETDWVPASLLDSVVKAVGAQARRKGLDLLLHLDPDLPAVLRGDALRLSQVLVHLAGNAVKFTEQGGVVVSIERWTTSNDGVTVRFSVTDTGIGLPEGAHAWLFDGFRQADGSASRRAGGLGLGLAICRALVQAMGGRIWAEDAPGGTTFLFEVRLQRGHLADMSTDRGPEEPPRRVLIVDDSTAFATLTSAYIGSLGHLPETAGDAETALERLRAATAAGTPFDAVLVDWHLPVMDGIEMARHVQSAGLHPSPVLVLVTGGDVAAAAQEARRKGIDCHALLEKPLTLRQVRDALARRPGATPDLLRAAPGAASGAMEGVRVLLVEDHPVNQELVKALVSRSGAQVETASNGREALELLARARVPFDLVLMDCQMPVMDGYAATEEIRRNPAWRDLPVIALTANAMPSDRERAFRCGMNDHVSKPVNAAVLLSTMVNWISRARPVAAAGPG